MFRVVSRLGIVLLVLMIGVLSVIGFKQYNKDRIFRKYINNFPKDSKPTAKGDAYQSQISSWARETDTLDIGNCRPNPLVLKIRNKSTLTVKNSGWNNQLFWITEIHNFLIPARGSESVYLDLENGPGLYGFGCGKFDKNFVVRGVLEVVDEIPEESPTTVALPSGVMSGIVVAENDRLILEPGGYYLQGEDIVLGEIFKRENYGKYLEISLPELQPGDQIYLNFYQNKDLVRGVIDQIVSDGMGWNLNLSGKPFYVKSGTKFYGEDPSGLFWDRGNQIDGLALGDIVEISSVGVIYKAPVLGAMTGTISLVHEVNGEKLIRIQNGKDDVWVGNYTLVYDQNKPQKRLDMSSLTERVGGYVLYYMYNGRLVAKSLGLYDL